MQCKLSHSRKEFSCRLYLNQPFIAQNQSYKVSKIIFIYKFLGKFFQSKQSHFLIFCKWEKKCHPFPCQTKKLEINFKRLRAIFYNSEVSSKNCRNQLLFLFAIIVKYVLFIARNFNFEWHKIDDVQRLRFNSNFVITSKKRSNI